MSDEPVTLYHYTCDHGHRGISRSATPLVLPGMDLPGPRPLALSVPWWAMSVAWFTDLDVPIREGLGLTQRLTRCDRTAWRYRVLSGHDVVPWMEARAAMPRHMRHGLEGATGALPRHWWVASVGVPVVLDQRGAAAS